MRAESAGLLVYRRREHGLEVLLVHPGGPFWAKKDDGAWSIPKGGIGDAPASGLTQLDPIRQAGGKIVRAWACEGDFDPATLTSMTLTTEWPPKSGRARSRCWTSW